MIRWYYLVLPYDIHTDPYCDSCDPFSPIWPQHFSYNVTCDCSDFGLRLSCYYFGWCDGSGSTTLPWTMTALSLPQSFVSNHRQMHPTWSFSKPHFWMNPFSFYYFWMFQPSIVAIVTFAVASTNAPASVAYSVKRFVPYTSKISLVPWPTYSVVDDNIIVYHPHSL